MNSNLTLSSWDTSRDKNITVTLSGINLQTSYWNINDLNLQIFKSFLHNTTLEIYKSTKNELSVIVSNSTIKHLKGSYIDLKIENTFITNHRTLTAALFSVNNSKVKITNCIFSDISVEGQNATAVLKSTESLVEIHNSTFSFNSASRSVFFGNKSQILITLSIFHDNRAVYGGSISAVESKVSVVESNFENNQAREVGSIDDHLKSSLIANNCTFLHNCVTAEINESIGGI